MTTIAYKNYQIAYDSRLVCGDIILDDDTEKSVKSDGVTFFVSGYLGQSDTLIAEYFSPKLGRKFPSNVDVAALVHREGTFEVERIGINGIYYCDKLNIDSSLAIGSGSELALGAMDAGCAAPKAVRLAGCRDINTGGTIRVYDLHDSVSYVVLSDGAYLQKSREVSDENEK